MTYIKLYCRIIIVLISLFFLSCQKEKTDHTKDDLYHNVTFILKAPKNTDCVTRGLTYNDESKIKNVTVLAFNQNDELMQLPYYIYQIEDTDTIEIKKFTVKIPNGTYNINLICNADNVIKKSKPSTGMTKTTLFNKLTITNESKWSTNTSTDAYLIPMWGEIANLEVIKEMAIDIKLIRMLAKLGVQLVGAAQSKFQLLYVFLQNRNTVGRIAPFNSSLDDSINYTKVINVSLPSNPGTSTESLEYSGAAVTSSSCLNEIYIFESSKTSTQKVRLFITGYRGGTLKYYILYLTKEIGGVLTQIDALRNHNYLFLIEDIVGDGYDSIEEAENAGNTRKSNATNISYKIIETDMGND